MMQYATIEQIKSQKTIKAVSLWQPWAILVASGFKKYETRSWGTNYRGSLLIHAAKRWTEDERAICYREAYRRTLKDIGYTNLDQIPLGYIVGIVELDGVHKTEYVYPLISDDEREFGNYASGRFAWHLSSAKLLPAVPYRGKQGLFDVDTSEIVRLLNPLVCENQG